MNKTRHPLIAVSLILLLIVPIGQSERIALADNVTPVAQTSHLIAAVPHSFPPHYDIDDHGRPYGFAIDDMNAVAEQAGLTVEYQAYATWHEAHQAIKEGQAHLIPNMGITPDRQSFVDFTSPVETFTVSLFVRAETEFINSIHDLAGHDIGVIKGNVAKKLLSDKQLKLKQYSQLSEALIELLSGHIDALAYPDSVVWRYTQQLGLDDHIRKLPPLTDRDQTCHCCA
ncbi:MAG: transporter substrate-binding domain-containing protein [Candidatus Thiodiazotropha sp. L084R]